MTRWRGTSSALRLLPPGDVSGRLGARRRQVEGSWRGCSGVPVLELRGLGVASRGGGRCNLTHAPSQIDGGGKGGTWYASGVRGAEGICGMLKGEMALGSVLRRVVTPRPDWEVGELRGRGGAFEAVPCVAAAVQCFFFELRPRVRLSPREPWAEGAATTGPRRPPPATAPAPVLSARTDSGRCPLAQSPLA